MNRFKALILLMTSIVATIPAQADAPARALLAESLRRHAPPPDVYEEQTFILSDARGRTHVRTARHYVRRDAEGIRRRLVIEAPVESRGVSIEVTHAVDGSNRRGPSPETGVFGSDFTLADLEGERVQDFDYEIAGTQDIGRIPHHLVRAWPQGAPGRPERHLFLRKDNGFVSRIDTFDPSGQLIRRMSFRDPQADESGAWRPGMILLENLASRRRTLLRIERRVHSSDYVPDSVFSADR